MGKKSRQGQKRKRKQQGALRRQNISPYRQVIRAPGEFLCYCTQDWEEEGIASILVLKTVPGGGHVMGAYLVDFWCCGLKDAWGRLEMTEAEFDEALADAGAHAPMGRVHLDLVQKMVAGGIRFARQNGFRLPHRYDRWVGLIGVAPDSSDADLDLFGVKDSDRPLRYVGTLEDLEQRLIGSSLEEFLSSPDVHYLLSDDMASAMEFEDIEDSEQLAEAQEEMEQLRDDLHERLLQGVRQWCFANQQVPHEALPVAVDAMLESLLQNPLAAEAEPEDVESDEVLEKSLELHERAVEVYGQQNQDDVWAATEQLRQWMQTFESSAAMIESLGLPTEDEEDLEEGEQEDRQDGGDKD